MESALQHDFANLFARIVTGAQQDLAPWQGSPYRELVAGVAPRAVPGLVVRCLIAALERQGLAAALPARGERAQAHLRIGAGAHYQVRAATRREQSPPFAFHGIEGALPTILLAIAPQRVNAWLVAPERLASLGASASGRLEVDPQAPPWHGGPGGDGSLSALIAALRTAPGR